MRSSCPYELIFHTHIEEKDTRKFQFIKKLFDQVELEEIALIIGLTAEAKILQLLGHLNTSI